MNARFDSVRNVLSRRSMTVDQICENVVTNPAWRNRGYVHTDQPLSPKTIRREVVDILRHEKEFVLENDRWRRRHWQHCSFCLTEAAHVRQMCAADIGTYICLECAEIAVDAMNKNKAKLARIAANEHAILSGVEMLGA